MKRPNVNEVLTEERKCEEQQTYHELILVSSDEHRPKDVHSEREDTDEHNAYSVQELADVLAHRVDWNVRFVDLESWIKGIHGCVHGVLETSENEEYDDEDLLPDLSSLVRLLLVLGVDSLIVSPKERTSKMTSQ